MSLLVDALKGLMLGIVVFGALPLALRPLGWDRKAEVIRFYWDLAIKALNRGLLAWQPNSGYQWVRTELDPLAETEKSRIGGERHDWSNDGEMMGRLHGRTIGIGLLNSQQILDARFLAVCKRLEELVADGAFSVKDGDTRYCREFVAFDGESVNGVWPGDADPHWIQERAPSTKTGVLVEFSKEAQSMFNSSTMWQAGKFLTVFGAVLGAFWLANEAAGTSPSTTIVGVIM